MCIQTIVYSAQIGSDEKKNFYLFVRERDLFDKLTMTCLLIS